MSVLNLNKKLFRLYVVAGAVLSSVVVQAAAYHNVGVWYKTQYNKLQFTTSAQSIYAENCSGTLTIQTKNPFGSVKNVSSNLTVNLSAPAGVTFYSDSACTSSITSVTISSGNSTANFYFIDTSTGSANITASAATYTSASQTETLSTNPFIWTGAGADAQWSTAANWSGGAAPGSSNVALFKGAACSTNCSPSIGTSININGIRMNSDYAGTITQGTGKTVTVGMGGWVQLAGTFVGSSSGDAITIGDSNLVINGGSFTSTSGTLTFGDNNLYWPLTLTVASGATFNHNGGSLVMNAPCANHSVSPGTATFNNVTFNGTCPTYNFNNSTMNIAGNLSFGNTSYGGNFNSGTLQVNGNLTSTGPNANGGSAAIQLKGNASGSTISTPSSGTLFNLTIDTGTNPVTLSGTVTLRGSYIVSTMGTLTATGSTLNFAGSWANFTLTPGSATYNNVTFSGSYGAVYNLGGATMNISGDLNLNALSGDGDTLNNGTYAVSGNVTATGPGGYTGSAIVSVTGNASGQTVTTVNGGAIPGLSINAGTNTVTLSGTVMLRGTYIVNSVGTLTTTGSTLKIIGQCTSHTITPGAITYNNVSIGGNCSTFTMGGNTMTIAGDLAFLAGGYTNGINSGTFAVSGNFTADNASGINGTAAIQFVGTGDQTINVGTSSLTSGNVTVNKASGNLILASNYTQSSTWNVTAGTIYMSGYNFTINGLGLNGNTIHLKDTGGTSAAGVLTVGGLVFSPGAHFGGTVAN